MQVGLGSLKMKMMGHLQQLLLTLLLLLLITTAVCLPVYGAATMLLEDEVEKQSTQPMVPALFVFGDSVLDAGTNSFFPSLLQANFKPYGTQYWGKPTGRFTNGRTYADFIANYIGLPIVEPYLKRKGKWSVITGVNYASAGSGLLRSSNAANKVIPYPDQILQFGQTKLQIEQTLKSTAAAKELFSRSLFLINIGANDVIGYIFNSSVPQQQFIDDLIVTLKDSLQVLYEAGGRKLVILATGPLGCVPGVLAALGVTNGKCVESFNNISKAYNTALEQFVLTLPETFPSIKAIVGKPYSKLHDFLTDGDSYGFTSGVTACCGSGIYNAVVQCGRPADIIANPPTNLCDNVETHVFWDFYHPTDKAYKLIVEDLWSGNSSSIAPVNIRTLVSL